MTPAEQREALVALGRQQSRLAELQLRLVAQAEAGDIGRETGATSTAAWHADATARTPVQTARLVRRARQLERHARVQVSAFDHVLHPDGSVTFHRRT